MMKSLVTTIVALMTVQAFAASNGTAELNKAMRLAGQDKTKQARVIVDALLNDKNSGVPQDRLLMTKARLLFQDGDMKHALETYQQVPSGSDYWLESLEEKAWAFTRQGEYGNALASLKTLKAPLFEPLVGPEPYFLTGLIHLKVCDYPKIFDSLKEFKEKFRPRLVAIQELSKTGTSQAAREAVEKLRTQPLEWKTIAVEANLLPRLFHRDAEMARLVKALQKGNATSANVLARLQQLAQRDMKETGLILQKMQLLEAEVIQRIHIAEKPGRSNRSSMIARNSDTLVFPDTDEYWIDELDKYHVNVSGCPGSDGGKKL
jgi:hypothetical protein